MSFSRLQWGEIFLMAGVVSVLMVTLSQMLGRTASAEEEKPSVEAQYLSMKSRFIHLMYVQSQVMDVFMLWTMLVIAVSLGSIKYVTSGRNMVGMMNNRRF